MIQSSRDALIDFEIVHIASAGACSFPQSTTESTDKYKTKLEMYRLIYLTFMSLLELGPM